MRLKRSIKIMMGDGLMKHPLQAVRAAVLLACIALVSAHVQPAQAQDFSNKPIRIIVGLVAGGATDVTARLIAQKLTESLHTNVYVENRPGAAFEPALRELTAAPPDGHTLFMISASVVVTQPFHKDYPFDLAKMTPVTEVSDGPFILVSRKTLPFKSVNDLVAYGKACLLYTSDAADEEDSVDLGGRRIIKKKTITPN